MGEGAADKALLLSGIDVGGWKAIVTPYRFPESTGRYVNMFEFFFLISSSSRAIAAVNIFISCHCSRITVNVTGYDNSLSEIESAMRQHFSSCGEISNFEFFSGSVYFIVEGEDAQDKVTDLDGSEMGGHTLHVMVVCGAITTVHTKRYSAKMF